MIINYLVSADLSAYFAPAQQPAVTHLPFNVANSEAPVAIIPSVISNIIFFLNYLKRI